MILILIYVKPVFPLLLCQHLIAIAPIISMFNNLSQLVKFVKILVAHVQDLYQLTVRHANLTALNNLIIPAHVIMDKIKMEIVLFHVKMITAYNVMLTNRFVRIALLHLFFKMVSVYVITGNSLIQQLKVVILAILRA